jgi:hypothetical protein
LLLVRIVEVARAELGLQGEGLKKPWEVWEEDFELKMSSIKQ